MSTPTELLDAYHRQVRGVLPSTQPEGVVVDRDGPLQRVSGGKHSGYVEYRDLAGLSGPALDELIERACAYFGGRRERFEWKTHSYDEPADLPSRLTAAGFVPGEVETVVVGLAEQLTAEPRLPDGVGIRRVSEAADFDRIGALHTEIWSEDWTWLAADLAERQAAAPESIAVFAAEAGPQMISVAWLVRDPRSEFATLWGGATRPEWRGKGIYRALVARRARFAVEHRGALPAGGRLRRQRPDPAAAGVRGGGHHHAVPVDTARETRQPVQPPRQARPSTLDG